MAALPPSDELIFFVNGRKVIERCADPEALLLNYLRKSLRLTGTKYGCGIGGCRACTVMVSTYNPDTKQIRHFPANSCLLPLCSLYGAAVTTVEGVGNTKTKLHPIQGAALVNIYLDGSVLVLCGGCELGQGLYTKVLQVASHELKIPVSYIHIFERSTVPVPNAIVTAGSISSEVNCKAVQNACQTLRKRLEPVIKENPEDKWEDWIKKAFEGSINLSATGYFEGYPTNMDWKKGEGHPFPYFVFGASCSEVEIDCLTGDHKNLQTDIVMDACYSINPGVDIGQIEGGFMQGLGFFTQEEIKFSPEGKQYTRGPDTYKIPAVCDVPKLFRIYLLPNTRNPIAIYSSKSMGETGVFMASSVFFAIKDAVAAARKQRGLNGVFTLDSPLNIARIRMACADHFTEMIPKDEPGTFKPWAIDIH